MPVVDEKRSDPITGSETGLKTPVFPGSAALRRALRSNIVSFPSRIPVVLKHPGADIQWRMVLLFFVRGWSSAAIAARFDVPKHRILKSLNEWSYRALALGHIQIIDPEAFAACCEVEVEYGTNRETEEVRLGRVEPALAGASRPFSNSTSAVVARVMLRPGGTQPEDRPLDSRAKSADLVNALDAAIVHCAEWRGQFWIRLTTLLRDMREAAAVALEVRQPARQRGEQTDGLFGAFPSAGSGLQHGLHVREEERVYHA
jgi:hypothetical protein